MSFSRLLETAIAYRFACIDRDASKKRFAQPHEAHQSHEHMQFVYEADKARHELVHAVLDLDIENAERLNGAMVTAWAHGQGLSDDEQTLPTESLVELVGAAAVVRALNRRPSAPGQPRTLRTTPDDRLIAALYAAANYDPVDPEEAAEAPVLTLVDRAVAVVAR